MKIKDIVLISLVVVAVIFIGIIAVKLPKNTSLQSGAVSTLDGVDSSCISLNGVRTCYAKQQFTATSTQICTIKNPMTATSTVMRVGINITSGILGANTFAISTTSSSALAGFGSSTPAMMTGWSLATQAIGTALFAPSVSTSSTPINTLSGITNAGGTPSTWILAPGEYLTVRIATTTSSGALSTYYGGYCSAVIQSL